MSSPRFEGSYPGSETAGFRPWNGRFLGALVAPGFMNLTLLATIGEDWSDLTTGDKDLIDLSSGTYEFIHTARSESGRMKAVRCSCR